MRRVEAWLRFGADRQGAPIPARLVGTMAESGTTIAFEFAQAFLDRPLPLSPFHLPPRPGLFTHDDRDFDRLPGVFADAMPDGFGRLVQDRAFEAAGMDRARVTPLDRLMALGDAGMGALSFLPARRSAAVVELQRPLDLAAIAAQGERLLEGSPEEVLPQLLLAGGSPGGARPKVLAGVHADGRVIAGLPMVPAGQEHAALPPGFVPWLVKFAAREDIIAFGRDAGAVEFAYSQMARTAGLDVPDARLFLAADERRWFGAERFDRHGTGGVGRRHVHSLGGLLHASHRLPALDYEAFLSATAALTRDVRAVEQAARRMCFNVFTHNRDDHARNVAFCMDERGTWSLAPAYDLTFSTGFAGHHTMAVGGETRTPTARTMQRLMRAAGLEASRTRAVLDEVLDAVATWPVVAQGLEIAPALIDRLAQTMDRVRRDARTAER